MNIDSKVSKLWHLVAVMSMLLATLASPLAGAQQEQEQPKEVGAIPVPSLGTDLWRGVRHSAAAPGMSQVAGLESGVLINPAGDRWRQMRTGALLRYSGWVLLGVIVAITLFYLARGSIRIEGGRSGQTVERWALWQRTLHWYVAIIFVILALTGLSILFGRTLILPVIGAEPFGALLQIAKLSHNYLGPAFVIGVALLLVAFLPYNLPTLTDVVWLVKGGGFFGKAHPHAGRVNAGEKIFTYWMMATVGVVACVTGVVLDFPNFEQPRELMQQANLLHAASAVIWVFFAIGHAFLGTAGVEGTFEGMWRGRVDVNWAKQHHDLWYDRLRTKNGAPGSRVDGEETETAMRSQPS